MLRVSNITSFENPPPTPVRWRYRHPRAWMMINGFAPWVWLLVIVAGLVLCAVYL